MFCIDVDVDIEIPRWLRGIPQDSEVVVSIYGIFMAIQSGYGPKAPSAEPVAPPDRQKSVRDIVLLPLVQRPEWPALGKQQESTTAWRRQKDAVTGGAMDLFFVAGEVGKCNGCGKVGVHKPFLVSCAA